MAEYAGYKVKLAKETATPGTYANIAQVLDISGPGVQADQIQVSHRDSTWRKYLPGLVDGGEVSFDIAFDPNDASHDPTVTTSMYADCINQKAGNYKLTFPGAGTATTTCILNAFVTKFETSEPVEDALTASITLKINGALTWAHVP